MHPSIGKILLNTVLVCAAALCMQCRGTPQRAEIGMPFGEGVRAHLQLVERWVVGVGGAFTYRVEEFETATVHDTTIESYGTGLIIYHHAGRAVVLTTRHLLVSEDTIIVYRRLTDGKPASPPVRRSVLVSAKHFVDDQSPQLHRAAVVCSDARSDLGLLLFETTRVPGESFPFGVLYERKLDWGEVVFLFGYPRQAKQLTFGIVSPSRYPGNFVVDATTRFGYSGGPMFVVEQDGTLHLAGIVRAMAAEGLDYVAPPPDVAPGETLNDEDVRRLRSARKRLIEYGTTFGVETERIGQFLLQCRESLAHEGVQLDARFLP